jgi:hypothetical protein
MKSPSQFKKDYYAGALMVLIGLGACTASVSYKIQTLARMGPGYFPFAIGVLMVITGVLIAISARGQDAPPPPMPGHLHGMPDLRGAACIIASIVAFIGFGEYLGLVPATFAVVFISALGDRTNTVGKSLILAVGMSVIATVVFWWALQLQMPLFKWGN